MTQSSRENDSRIEKLNKELEDASEQIENLLEIVHDTEINFASVKTELRILCENVKELTNSYHHNTVHVTELALLKQKIEIFEKQLEKLTDTRPSTQIELADKAGKWQLRVALVTGIVGIVTAILSMTLQHTNSRKGVEPTRDRQVNTNTVPTTSDSSNKKN